MSVVTCSSFIRCAVTTACSYLVFPILGKRACVFCFLNFMRFKFKFKNCLLGRSPLGPPDTPNFEKFGEVVEVIILLYYLGCRGVPALAAQNYFLTCVRGHPTTIKRNTKHGVWQHHAYEDKNINRVCALNCGEIRLV